MRVALGSDHAGYDLKAAIKEYLQGQGIAHQDFGTFSQEAVDYPDYALAVAQAVSGGSFDYGILVCGTGLGVCIAANKVAGVRAVCCHDTFSARSAREHNNANVLTLGQRVVGPGLALEVVKVFLDASFAGGRHARRVEKITAIEEKYRCGH
ncbi:MAG: ribose 5-phosphate isomerase B [Clostridia bacterium]|nr:MAG: ribose 5-phosphate isomerase B [Clostridia bacterium]